MLESPPRLIENLIGISTGADAVRRARIGLQNDPGTLFEACQDLIKCGGREKGIKWLEDAWTGIDRRPNRDAGQPTVLHQAIASELSSNFGTEDRINYSLLETDVRTHICCAALALLFKQLPLSKRKEVEPLLKGVQTWRERATGDSSDWKHVLSNWDKGGVDDPVSLLDRWFADANSAADSAGRLAPIWDLSRIFLGNCDRTPRQRLHAQILVYDGRGGVLELHVQLMGKNGCTIYPHPLYMSFVPIRKSFWSATQQAWEMAIQYAGLEGNPGIVRFWITGHKQQPLLGGSHGVAMAVALTQLLRRQPLDPGTAITIRLPELPRGDLRHVGRVFQKVLGVYRKNKEQQEEEQEDKPDLSPVVRKGISTVIIHPDDWPEAQAAVNAYDENAHGPSIELKTAKTLDEACRKASGFVEGLKKYLDQLAKAADVESDQAFFLEGKKLSDLYVEADVVQQVIDPAARQKDDRTRDGDNGGGRQEQLPTSYLDDNEEQREKEHRSTWDEALGHARKTAQFRGVLLGGPGQGKSTCLEMTVRDLARHALDDLQQQKPIEHLELPIMLPLKELCEDFPSDRADKALRSRLAELLETRYALTPETAAHIAKRASDGNTWLVLDGLDEAAGESRTLSRIWEALKTWRCRVLIASRPYADPASAIGFSATVFRLAPFTPSQIQQFLRAWFGEDDYHAMRGVLRQNPSLGQMSQTPFLLTLLLGSEDELGLDLGFRIVRLVGPLADREDVRALVVTALVASELGNEGQRYRIRHPDRVAAFTQMDSQDASDQLIRQLLRSIEGEPRLFSSATRILEVLGEARETDEVIRFLSESLYEEGSWSVAAESLGKMHSEEARDLSLNRLSELLDDENNLGSVVRVLENIGPEAARTDIISKLLTLFSNAGTPLRDLFGAASIYDKAFPSFLLEAGANREDLGDYVPRLLNRICAACSTIRERHLSDGDDEEYYDEIDQAKRGCRIVTRVLCTVFRAGSFSVREQILDRIVELLRDDDPFVREAFVNAVARIGPEAARNDVLARLVEMLEEGVPDDDKVVFCDHVQSAAAEALAKMGVTGADGGVQNRIARSFQTHPLLVAKCVRSWHSEVQKRLVQLFQTDSMHAALCVGWMGVDKESATPRSIVDCLIRMLQSGSEEERRRAAETFSALGPCAVYSEILAALSDSLQDPDEDVRKHASEALLRCITPAVKATNIDAMLDCLVRLMTSAPNTSEEQQWENYWYAPQAATSVGRLGVQAARPDVVDALFDLLTAFENNIDYDFRCVAEALGKLASSDNRDELLDRLLALFRGPDGRPNPSFQQHAALVIETMGPLAAREDVVIQLVNLLESEYESHDSYAVMAAAADALRTMGPDAAHSKAIPLAVATHLMVPCTGLPAKYADEFLVLADPSWFELRRQPPKKAARSVQNRLRNKSRTDALSCTASR